jgi:hypothetical protein
MHNMFKVDDRHQWLRDADLTYCAARYLLFSEDVFFRPSGGYLLHLAVEKYFKAMRRIVRPQIDMRQGGHDLRSLHASIVKKVKSLDTPRIYEAVKKLVDLEGWRYVDTMSSQGRQEMDQGLASADVVVATVRDEVPYEVLYQGLHCLLSNKGPHRRSLIKALFQHNAQGAYWKRALLGIDGRLDAMIKKYAGN